MKEPVTQNILHAYFENRATAHEKLLVKEWLKEEGNEEIFYQHLASWEASHLQFKADVDGATQRYKNFLNNGAKESATVIERRRSVSISFFNLKYASVAAAVALVLGFSMFMGKDYLFYDTYSTGYGMTKNIMLEDGSEITLNANSTLKVPKDLANADMREVWLQGEGFFSIAKRPHHVRFAVHANNVNVEVLGTKFNVNNRRGKTEVVLAEGSVKLTTENGTHAVFMKPGDYISVAERDTTFKRQVVRPQKYSAWQSNKLIFEDAPLRVVADKIEDYYGVDIKIERKEIADRQMTGTLPNNDLGIVLKSLSTAHNLTIDRKDNQIILR